MCSQAYWALNRIFDMQTVAEVMAEDLDIRFGSVVTSINYEGEGVFVRVASGEVLEADAVIVTVSLGVLKVSCG